MSPPAPRASSTRARWRTRTCCSSATSSRPRSRGRSTTSTASATSRSCSACSSLLHGVCGSRLVPRRWRTPRPGGGLSAARGARGLAEPPLLHRPRRSRASAPASRTSRCRCSRTSTRGSAWAVTAVLIPDLLPAILFGPLLGALVDRIGWRTCAIAADLLRMVGLHARRVRRTRCRAMVFARRARGHRRRAVRARRAGRRDAASRRASAGPPRSACSARSTTSG